MSKSNTQRPKTRPMRQSLSAPASSIQLNAPVYPERLNRLSDPSAPSTQCVSAVSPARPQRLSSAGEGGSKYNQQNPQPKKQRNPNFPQRKCENKTNSATYPITKSAKLTKKTTPHHHLTSPNSQNQNHQQPYPQTQWEKRQNPLIPASRLTILKGHGRGAPFIFLQIPPPEA